MTSTTTSPAVNSATQAKVAIAQKVTTIGFHVVRDRLTRPEATASHQVPWSTEAISTAWLNDVLCASHPGAKVLSMELGSGTSGTTNRRKIKVTYNDAGTEASLPTRLFNKATASLTSRLVLGLSGRGERPPSSTTPGAFTDSRRSMGCTPGCSPSDGVPCNRGCSQMKSPSPSSNA